MWARSGCDTRVFTFLDEMNKSDREQLLVVEASKGSISFIWWGHVPNQSYYAGGCVYVEGDCWSIIDCVTI